MSMFLKVAWWRAKQGHKFCDMDSIIKYAIWICIIDKGKGVNNILSLSKSELSINFSQSITHDHSDVLYVHFVALI